MLLRPWDFPGKSTGVGCHFLLQGSFPTQGSTQISCIAGRHSTFWATGEAPLFIFSWPYHMACGISVPWPGMKLAPPALEAQSPNHWTAREVSWIMTLVFLASVILSPTRVKFGHSSTSREMFLMTRCHLRHSLKMQIPRGLPWWLSGKESSCQCKRHTFNPWSGKIPHAEGQLSPGFTTVEPVSCNCWRPHALEPVLRNKRSHGYEKPMHRNEEEPPLATTREILCFNKRASTARKKRK